MKKLLATLIVTVMLAAVACVAAGCYNSKPAVMSELVGVYELTQFTRWHTEGEGEQATTQESDLKAEKGIRAYLVVNDNGRGYYVYKDNEGLSAKEVAITYTYDDKDPTQIKEITYSDGLATTGDGYPGKGRETLGLTFKLKDKTLNYYYAQFNGKLLNRDYSQKVIYKKVSKSPALSYVESKLGVQLNVPRMEIGGLDGWQVYESYNESDQYLYYYLELNAAQGSAEVYYALREDLSFFHYTRSLTFDVPDDKSQPIAIHVGDDVFYAYNYVTTIPTTIWHQDEMGLQDMWFGHYDHDSFDFKITEVVNSIKSTIEYKMQTGELSRNTTGEEIFEWLQNTEFALMDPSGTVTGDRPPQPTGTRPHIRIGCADTTKIGVTGIKIYVMNRYYYLTMTVDAEGYVTVGQKNLY